jgi:hypothetical protein
LEELAHKVIDQFTDTEFNSKLSSLKMEYDALLNAPVRPVGGE